MNKYTSPFLGIISRALLNLKEDLSSKSQTEYLLTQLGWKVNLKPNEVALIQGFFNLEPILAQIKILADDLCYQRGNSTTLANTLLLTVKEIYATVSVYSDGFIGSTSIAPFNQPTFWEALSQELVPFLLIRELKETSPGIYGLLFLAGVISEVEENSTNEFRLPYVRPELNWNALSEFLSNPSTSLEQRYSWGSDSVMDYKKALRDLSILTSLFSLRPRISAVPSSIGLTYYTPLELRQHSISSFILPFVSGIKPDGTGIMELGLSLTPIPSTPLTSQAPEGFLLAPYLHGEYTGSVPLSSTLSLEFVGGFAADNAFGAEILPGGVNLKTDVGSTAIGAELRLIGKPPVPIRFFGTDDSSRLELSGYSIGVAVTGTAAKPEVMVKAGTGAATGSEKLTLFIVPGEGDSFISKVFGSDPIQVDAAGFITWSSRTGLGFDGAFGLRRHSTENRKIGPVLLQGYTVEIATRTGEPLVANATINSQVELGPVTAIVENLGLSFRLVNNKEGKKGLLDNIDVAWGFKSPSGIGIVVDSDTIKGGGFLSVDPAAHRYTGAANLTFRDKLTLNAVGILQTELPDGQDGYSLLLLVTAQFSPIQLGLGFTLNGVGGLVGVNRTVDIRRSLVQSLKSLVVQPK